MLLLLLLLLRHLHCRVHRRRVLDVHRANVCCHAGQPPRCPRSDAASKARPRASVCVCFVCASPPDYLCSTLRPVSGAMARELCIRSLLLAPAACRRRNASLWRLLRAWPCFASACRYWNVHRRVAVVAGACPLPPFSGWGCLYLLPSFARLPSLTVAPGDSHHCCSYTQHHSMPQASGCCDECMRTARRGCRPMQTASPPALRSGCHCPACRRGAGHACTPRRGLQLKNDCGMQETASARCDQCRSSRGSG